jgi:hypothetical protein
MPKGNRANRAQTYQYQATDNPADLATKLGTSPQQLLNANPGGYPFDTGQTINVPYFDTGSRNQFPYVYNATKSDPFDDYKSPSLPFNRSPDLSGPIQGPPRVNQPSYGPAQTNNQFRGDTGFSRLSAFVKLNPEIDFDQMDRQAQDAFVRLQVLQGNMAPGTTIDDILGTTPSEGKIYQGTATPFGENAQGQRLDSSGNVWDPEKAERDMYGGKFRYAGETRFSRNSRGKIVKQMLTKGNKWVTINKRAGKRNKQNQQQTQQRKEPLATTSFGVVNFNVGTG